jgi:hypothetical protein
MNNELTDLELEYELEELYILSKHWMQDISFVEAELRFFKEIADKYSAADSRENNLSTLQRFKQKMVCQEANLAALKDCVPEYLKSLEPYIKDLEKTIPVNLIEQVTGLQTNVQMMFGEFKSLRKELFEVAEKIIKDHGQIPG